ncbi:MAG: putative peptidoglycan glycosyltransferase FtsW [bacterium]|nr:putative peptidoglycan glycosyltransferase FtsW [bacterium]
MKKVDGILLGIIFLLCLFGLFMVYNASSVIALRDFQDKYYYIKEQSVWMVLGFGALFFFSVFSYKRLYVFAVPLLIASIVLLLLVFIPGIGIRALGAHRWINLHFFVLQPAEFVKLSLAIYLAAWFSTKEKGRFLAFLLLMGTVWLLVMLQPDMGTASIIVFEAAVLYFLSGGAVRHFFYIAPVAGLVGFLFIKAAPYRAARLTSFLNVDPTLSNVSYHTKQILIALGSGGILGVGIGNSLQKYAYLPENVTDSIFAIIAEEVGFVGASILVIIFALVIWRGFVIASHAKDTFGKLLAAGITSFLGIQIVINLFSMTALMPLTGVPLPFISYGGSALIIDLAAIGMLLNISQTK